MNPSLRDRGSTGDASFDGRFHGRSPGPNHALLAALSSRLRQQLSFAHGRSFESLTADREAVTFRFLRSPCKVADLAQVEDTIRRCIAPAQTLLYDRAPLADELLHNALHDPLEGCD